MLKIAICEDNSVYAQKLYTMIHSILTVPLESTVFSAGEDFLSACENNECPFDIVLMDIDLGPDSISGISLSQKINLMNPDTQIIYISQYLQYAPKVYETSHTYFINKDQLDRFLGKALQAAFHNLQSLEKQYLYFERKQQPFKILQNDIIYMERILRVTEIHARQETYTASERLPVLMNQLSPAFVLCHRSFLINLNVVSSMSRTEVIFLDGQRVPMSRGYYANVKKAFAQLMLTQL